MLHLTHSPVGLWCQFEAQSSRSVVTETIRVFSQCLLSTDCQILVAKSYMTLNTTDWCNRVWTSGMYHEGNMKFPKIWDMNQQVLGGDIYKFKHNFFLGPGQQNPSTLFLLNQEQKSILISNKITDIDICVSEIRHVLQCISCSKPLKKLFHHSEIPPFYNQ